MAPPSWLETVWAEREEVLYPALFGPLRGIFPIPAARFQRLDVDPDPRWLTIGVFEAAPTPQRPTWVYVTSGLSNPWEDERDPAALCGFGCEFLLETTRQGPWAIGLLHHLASLQLVALSGALDRPPLQRGARLNLHGPIDGDASPLRHLLLTEPAGFPPVLAQRSGEADWLCGVGLTDAERAFAQAHGNDALLARLRAAGHGTVTDPGRGDVAD